MTDASFKAAAEARIVEWQKERQFLRDQHDRLRAELARVSERIAMTDQNITNERNSVKPDK